MFIAPKSTGKKSGGSKLSSKTSVSQLPPITKLAVQRSTPKDIHTWELSEKARATISTETGEEYHISLAGFIAEFSIWLSSGECPFNAESISPSLRYAHLRRPTPGGRTQRLATLCERGTQGAHWTEVGHVRKHVDTIEVPFIRFEAPTTKGTSETTSVKSQAPPSKRLAPKIPAVPAARPASPTLESSEHESEAQTALEANGSDHEMATIESEGMDVNDSDDPDSPAQEANVPIGVVLGWSRAFQAIANVEIGPDATYRDLERQGYFGAVSKIPKMSIKMYDALLGDQEAKDDVRRYRIPSYKTAKKMRDVGEGWNEAPNWMKEEMRPLIWPGIKDLKFRS